MGREREFPQAFVIQKGSRIRLAPPDRLLRVKDPNVRNMAATMLDHPEIPIQVLVLRQKGRPTRLIPLEVSQQFRSRLEGLKGV